MWRQILTATFRAIVAITCVVYLSGKWNGTATPAAPRSDDIVTGSIEKTPLSIASNDDRLAQDMNAAVRTASAGKDLLVFRAILAAAETKNPSAGQGGPRNSAPGPDINMPDPDLPPMMDPQYDTWQKDADQKLAGERAQAVGKEHPLATANPDSYIVICLAGCRPSSDVITYRVSKTAAAAAAIAARRMETTAAERGANAKVASDDPQNATVCVAGCYDDEKPSPAKKRKHAEVITPLTKPVHSKPVRVAALTPREAAKPAAAATVPLSEIHRISAATRAHVAKTRVKFLVAARATARSVVANSWHAKIIREPQPKKRVAALLAKKQRFVAAKHKHFATSKQQKIVTEASGFVF